MLRAILAARRAALCVMRITSTGDISDTRRFLAIVSSSFDVKIHALSGITEPSDFGRRGINFLATLPNYPSAVASLAHAKNLCNLRLRRRLICAQ